MDLLKQYYITQKASDFLLRYDYSIKQPFKHSFYMFDYNEYVISTDDKEEYRGTFNQSLLYFRKNYVKDSFKYKGFSAYIGLVSLIDNTIEDIISANKVFENDSHHCLFLTRGQFERVENGESSLFIVLNKKVIPYFTHSLPNNVISEIEKQIEIL